MISMRRPASVVGRCRPPPHPTSLPALREQGWVRHTVLSGSWLQVGSVHRENERRRRPSRRGRERVFPGSLRLCLPRSPHLCSPQGPTSSWTAPPPPSANPSPPGEDCLRGALPASSHKHPAHAKCCLPATTPSPKRPGSQPCSPWSPPPSSSYGLPLHVLFSFSSFLTLLL